MTWLVTVSLLGHATFLYIFFRLTREKFPQPSHSCGPVVTKRERQKRKPKVQDDAKAFEQERKEAKEIPLN